MIPVLIGVLIVIITSYIILSTQKPKGFPPGPRWLPFVGSLSELKRVSKEAGGQHLGLLKLAEQYDTNVLGLKLGSNNVIVASSYPVVKAVLTRDEFIGRPDTFFLRIRCLGSRKGITCVDGPYWSTQRSFLVHHLRNLGFGKKLMETMIKDELSDLLQSIAERTSPTNNNSIVTLSSLIPCSVLNILWALIAGARIPKSDPKLAKFLELMQTRSKSFDMTGGMLSQYPWLRFLAPEYSGYNLLLRLNNQLKEFVMEPIREHLEKWYPGRNDDFIYTYITRMNEENDNETFTIDQLIMVCIDVFIGGSVTTSSTLDYAFLMMILHPDVQAKVQAHLDQSVGRNRTIEYSDRLQMPYVEAVLLEIERYFTVAPITGPRRVLENTVLDGYNIPKNTTVLINIYSIHRDKKFWEDPDEFKPQRFLDSNGQLEYNDKLILFGLGKRRCLAEVLARNCIFMFFAGILREFTITADPAMPMPTARQVPGITCSAEKYSACFLKRMS